MANETGLTEQVRTLHRQSRHEEVIARLEGKPTDDNPELHLLLGLAYFMSSDQQRGLEMIQRALETEPANNAWRSDAALAKMVTGDVGTAATWLEEVIADDAPAAVDFGRLAAVRVSQGLQDSAVEAYREAIHREPGREHWHHNLASVYLRMGKLEQALEHYDAALSIAPDFDRSITGRRALLTALDKSEELVEELEAQLASDEDNINFRVQLAWALDQDNRLSEAIRCLGHSVKPVKEILDTEDADPDDVKGETEAGGNAEKESPGDFVAEQITLRLAQAELFHKHSRHGLALRRWDEVSELTKEENPGIVCARSNALVELGRYQEAEALLDEAQETSPDNNPLNIARSHLLVERGDYEAAEKLLQSLVEVYPGNANLLTNLGQSLLWVGKLDEAAECFERAGEINPMALAHIVRTRKMPRNAQALEKMASIADNRLIPKAARGSMNFALADLYDREQEFDKAARFMATANELINSELNYSADQFSRKIDNIIRVFSRDYFENLPAIRRSDRVPVFVVGMPRSGTTLTEQILSSHPEVFGAGELELLPVLTRLMPRVLKAGSLFPGCMRAMTGELREEAARYYLYGLQQHDEDSHYVVDKMPHNFVNLGLIASVLPGARIVHVTRDPRDTALSNYLQNFKAREGGMGYAFHLGNLARQLNDYARIMSHWREVLPVSVFELNYEELVEDQEGMTRKLLQFIGVDWHEDVRDFYKTERAVRTASVSQVRQPIYQSSRQKWRHYEEMLQPLISLLDQEPAGR